MNRVLENIKEEPEEETIEETRLKINLVQSKNRAIKLPSTKIQFKSRYWNHTVSPISILINYITQLK